MQLTPPPDLQLFLIAALPTPLPCPVADWVAIHHVCSHLAGAVHPAAGEVRLRTSVAGKAAPICPALKNVAASWSYSAPPCLCGHSACLRLPLSLQPCSGVFGHVTRLFKRGESLEVRAAMSHPGRIFFSVALRRRTTFETQTHVAASPLRPSASLRMTGSWTATPPWGAACCAWKATMCDRACHLGWLWRQRQRPLQVAAPAIWQAAEGRPAACWARCGGRLRRLRQRRLQSGSRAGAAGWHACCLAGAARAAAAKQQRDCMLRWRRLAAG